MVRKYEYIFKSQAQAAEKVLVTRSSGLFLRGRKGEERKII